MSKVDKNRKKIKTGGRKKGTPNKRTQSLQERIAKDYPNFDPVISMIEIAQDNKTPLDLKITCLKEVSKYIHAQRKAVELETDKEIGLRIIVADKKHQDMLEDL